MIIFRKLIYDNDENDYEIYQYNTETKLERMVWGNNEPFNDDWSKYSIPAEHVNEFDITEEDAFLEMI